MSKEGDVSRELVVLDEAVMQLAEVPSGPSGPLRGVSLQPVEVQREFLPEPPEPGEGDGR